MINNRQKYSFFSTAPQLTRCLIMLLLWTVTASSWAKNNDVDRIVAIVNDDIITELELQKELNNVKLQLRQRRTAIPPDGALRKQILDRMVLLNIQLQQARDRHIRVDDETLNRAVENIARQNGMRLAQFRQALSNDGIDFADFRERIRDEITINQLQQRLVRNKILVTEQEIQEFLSNQALQNSTQNEYQLQHILMVVPEAASAEKIQRVRSEAETVLKQLKQGEDFAQMAVAKSAGQQALQGGDLGWLKLAQIPTLFADSVQSMKVGDISELIRSPSGFHIIRLNDVRQDNPQHIIKQTKVRHILIKPSDVLTAEQAEARINEIRQRLEQGEDFANLATAHSDDKATAINGGDLGWVNPGQMVKEFEQSMLNTEPGQISEVFQTRFGWHILQVLERREHDNTDAYLRNQARELIQQRKIQPAVENWLRRLRDEAYVELRLEQG